MNPTRWFAVYEWKSHCPDGRTAGIHPTPQWFTSDRINLNATFGQEAESTKWAANTLAVEMS